MRSIQVKFNGIEYSFYSNNSGRYLFINYECSGLFQICSESGYDSLSRIKTRIKKYLRFGYELRTFSPTRCPEYPRITYIPDMSEWKK